MTTTSKDNQGLTPARKELLNKAVKKTVEQYGETLKMLGEANQDEEHVHTTVTDGNICLYCGHTVPSPTNSNDELQRTDITKLIMKEVGCGYAKAADILDYAITPTMATEVKKAREQALDTIKESIWYVGTPDGSGGEYVVSLSDIERALTTPPKANP